MLDVHIGSGQSNRSAYPPCINLRDDSLPPPYVPGYAQTALNEWTGAAPVSLDTGFQYRIPSPANYPCKYVENLAGTVAAIQDGWGTFAKQQPDLSVVGSYGPELSFIYRHLQVYPTRGIAYIKVSLGGTSIRADWLPYSVQLGTAQGGTANTIILTASDFGTSGQYVGLYLKVLSGPAAGEVVQITAYDQPTKTATVSPNFSTPPTGASTYGIERLQMQILRVMLAQAAARLDLDPGPGNWRWASFGWLQGESGAHSAGTAADDSQYRSDARALFAFVRTLTRSDLPVLVNVIPDNWGWEVNPNPYLMTAGYPYAAIDASYWFSNSPFDGDGRRASPTQSRADFLAGAVARRASLRTLGGDVNCAVVSHDGYPIRPPYSLTADVTDKTGYHWGGPGVLTAGEREFTAFQVNFGPHAAGRTPVRFGTGRARAKVRVAGVRM